MRRPSIWLLDEPTASMDSGSETKVLQAFHQTLGSDDTLVVVTHKLELLQLVDRIIVIANNQVVMDGAKNQVIERLSKPNKNKNVEAD